MPQPVYQFECFDGGKSHPRLTPSSRLAIGLQQIGARMELEDFIIQRTIFPPLPAALCTMLAWRWEKTREERCSAAAMSGGGGSALRCKSIFSSVGGPS